MYRAQSCAVCGELVDDEHPGVVVVHPDPVAGDRVEYFCAAHHPNPPTPEMVAEAERQELQAAVAAMGAEEQRIRRLIDLDRPVSPTDRSEIGRLLLGMHRRFIWVQNEVRSLQGKEPLPTPATRTAPASDRGRGTHSEQALPPPNYRIVVEHLWDPSPDDQTHGQTDVRFAEVLLAVQAEGARFAGGSPGERESRVTFHAQDDATVERIRESLEVPGRHRVREVQYLPAFPEGAPRTIWRREPD
jgi:hypothetical protein